MELSEYNSIFHLEETHWWYKALRNLIFSEIDNFALKKERPAILDAGCGAGTTLRGLGGYGQAVGIDISGEALKYCGKRGLRGILKASVNQIPFQDESFDVVVCIDVLYHKQVVNDQAALGEVYRVLKKGGFFIGHLPAHNYLKRGHDEVVHTRHRYTTAELQKKLKISRFKIIKLTYRNALLFPLLLLFRIIPRKENKKAGSDLKPINRVINSVLYTVMRLENLFLKFINIPAGTSVFCVSRK